MALKPKSVSRNGSNGAPSKITINSSTAGSLEQLKKEAARTPSRVIRLRDKELGHATLSMVFSAMGSGAVYRVTMLASLTGIALLVLLPAGWQTWLTWVLARYACCI